MRKHPIDPEAIKLAAKALANDLPVRLSEEKLFKITLNIINAYRDNAKVNLFNNRKLSPITTRLAAMSIGEIEFFDCYSLQVIRQRMNTAREIMQHEGARWICDVKDTRVRVTRIEDFAAVKRYKALGKITIELSSMQVGDTHKSKNIKRVRGKGQMGTNHKMKARQLLDNPKANWKVRSRKDGGVQITRIN